MKDKIFRSSPTTFDELPAVENENMELLSFIHELSQSSFTFLGHGINQ